jgi:hypothetical protein
VTVEKSDATMVEQLVGMKDTLSVVEMVALLDVLSVGLLVVQLELLKDDSMDVKWAEKMV